MEFEGISEGVGGEGVGIGQPSLVFGTICCLATKGGVFAKQEWSRSGAQYSGPGTHAGEVARPHSQEYRSRSMICPILRPKIPGRLGRHYRGG